MASFDIESLFTNIPLKETIDLCVDILFTNTTNMSESLVLFDEKFYKQIDRIAMGSPFGPTLTSIFFCFH